jgi:hypothetical protein
MGTATITTYTPVVDVGDVITAFKATIAGNITRNQAVVVVDNVANSGALLGTLSRSSVTLTADLLTLSGNVTKAGTTLVNATAGGFAGVVVGSKIVHTLTAGPNTVTTLTVTDVVNETTVNVAESGTLGVGTCTNQIPAFAKVYVGAVLNVAAGTAATVTAKASDFSVTTTETGTLTNVAFTSYTNLATIVPWKENNSRGEVDGIAMATFTYTTAIPSADIQVKMHGVYARNALLTADTAAGSVTTDIHDVMTGRGFQGVVTQYNEF